MSDGGDTAQQYVYDGEDIVLAFDKSAALTNRYLHGPAVDQILADEQYGATGSHDDPNAEVGAVYWPLADNLGSVRQLVDSNGEEAERFTYDSFGQMATEPGGDGISHIYGYTGREHDAESHLQFNRARYYDAALGRFISEDPLGLGPDINPHRYVGNGPTNATDSSGLFEDFGGNEWKGPTKERVGPDGKKYFKSHKDGYWYEHKGIRKETITVQSESRGLHKREINVIIKGERITESWLIAKLELSICGDYGWLKIAGWGRKVAAAGILGDAEKLEEDIS